MTSPEPKCVTCRKPIVGHYRVTAIGADLQEKGSVKACSIVCLVQWAYHFAAQQGVKGTMMIRGALKDPDLLRKLIKGIAAKL